jgi:hypothetical protein
MRPPRTARTSKRFTPRIVAVLFVSAMVLASCSDDAVERLASASTTTTAPANTGVVSGAAPTTAPNATPPSTGRGATPSTTGTAVAAPATSPVTTSRAAALFGVPVGAAADGAVTTLVTLLGQPTTDTGWGIGCTLDSPTNKNERVVTWGHLRVQFRRDTEAAAGTMQGYGFVVAKGDALAPTDAAARLVLPSGIALGMPIADVATKLSVKIVVNGTFGWVEVTTPGATFTADGSAGTAPFNAVAVPRVFSCD